MVKVNRLLALLSLVTLAASGAAIACGGSTELAPSGQPGTETTNPETGLNVKATIAAASLGNGTANVQMAFFASEATAPATVAITKVLLVDAKTGETVQTLEASAPSVWNGRSYEPWNEKVTPGGDLRASYTLSAPSWSGSSYSVQYKLRVTLRIDGDELTIESRELQREPEVVT
jgi:hypothetical protein